MYIYLLLARKKHLADELMAFYCALYFSALESLKKAVVLQEEVLDTHEELILTHQAISGVLKCLGREVEAEEELELALEATHHLDSLQVPIERLQISEENGWTVYPCTPH